ncbi:MAG: SocA family protein [candidate division Zixibacteria bacterium]|nr:SocA family protein [candidate division Zixibacteria bacterium]
MVEVALSKTERVPKRATLAPKLKEIIIYVLDLCRHKPIVGESALNTILYFADFIHYATTGCSITGVRYIKEKLGPVPAEDALQAAWDELVDESRLRVREELSFDSPKRVPIVIGRADRTLFAKSELEIVDFVLNHFCKYSTTEIAGITSSDLGWRMAELGAEIPYHTVWIRRRNILTADAVERAMMRARLAHKGVRDNSMSWGRVTSSHPFDANWQRLEREHPRGADVLADIVYVLSKEPRQFNKVDDASRLWAVRTDEGPWERTPALDVVYQIDELMGTVTLLSAETAQV